MSRSTPTGRLSLRHPELRILSMACVPIRSANKTLAVLQLLNSKLDLLSEYSLSFLRILCDYAAIAIQNARSMDLIHQLSITDDCTGLYNARHLYSLMDECILRHKAGLTEPFSLIFMDLDRFKSVNDRHGHLIGSRLLAEVGKMMKKRRLPRMAGPSATAATSSSSSFPERPSSKPFRRPRVSSKGSARPTSLKTIQPPCASPAASASPAFPRMAESVQDMLGAADTMLYKAKNTTRDNLAIMGQGLLIAPPDEPQSRGRRSKVAGRIGSGFKASRFSGAVGCTPKSQTPRFTSRSETTSISAYSPNPSCSPGVNFIQCPPGKNLTACLHILLRPLILPPQRTNRKAHQIPRVPPHIRPHNHVPARRRATRRHHRRIPLRAMRVNHHRRAPRRRARIVPQPQINHWSIDMRLHGRSHPPNLHDLVRTRHRVHYPPYITVPRILV